MSGATIISPNTVDTTVIIDNTTGLDTPAGVRQLSDSLAGMVITSIVTTSGASAYTYAATDRGCIVVYNSTSAGTFTVPANIFLTYSMIGFRSINTGQLTIAAGGGFTLNVPTSLSTTPAQWETGFVHFTSATAGVLM